MTVESFFVAGSPITQGSAMARVRKDGSPFVVQVNRSNLMDWRSAIGSAAQGLTFREGPCDVHLMFRLARPKSRPKKDVHPDRRPDLDKLTRAALDALTGVAYKDDSQVVALHVYKAYAIGQTGVQVSICDPGEPVDWVP